MSKHKLIAERGAPVIPSDTTDIISIADPTVYSGGSLLFVGTGGDVKVRTQGGDDVTFAGVADGSFLPVVVVRVFDTGTSASNLVSMPRDIGDKPVSAPAPTFASIFGANYYDDWDFNDLSTISQSGSGLIDSITSKGTNGGVFTSTGSIRPTSVLNATLGKYVGDFDGVSDIMSVAASTAMYNFLHNASGAVFFIGNINSIVGNNWLIGNGQTAISQVAFNYYVLATDLKLLVNNGTRTINSTTANSSVSGNKFDSLIVTVDNTNATPLDRSELIANGASFKNNVATDTGSVSNAQSNLKIGNAFGGSNYFNGQIARIVIIDTLPTPTQLAQVQTLLTSEYGTFPIS